MSQVLKRPMSVEDFLAWEQRQELKHEFDGLRPIAMTGGTAAHSAIQANIIHAFVGRLRGHRCRVHGSELKILVGGSIRYPEAFVVCTPLSPKATFVSDPVVIFEVLSESSVDTDLVVKNAEYRDTPSVQRYVVLEQTHAGALVFYRKGEDWLAGTAGPQGVLHFPELGFDIPLSEFYTGVEVTASQPQPDPG